MGSRIFLTNIASDVSGYLLALVDMRNPNLPATVPSAITNVVGSQTSTSNMTTTAGGTTLAKWITRKLSAAVTIGGTSTERYFVNMSTAEGSGVHYGVNIQLAQYTGGAQQATFLADTYVLTQNPNTAIELSTTSSPVGWVTTIPSTWTTSTIAFAAGDRLVILPFVARVGTGTGAGSVFMYYDGAASALGDTYIEVYEILQVSQAQVGSSTSVGVKSKGVSYFQNLINDINDADIGSTTGSWLSDDTTIKAALNEATNQQKLV